MCDFCKSIGTEEKAILTHELDVGDVVKYRDAYRLTKYQLEKALKEIKELKEKTQK